MKVFRLRLILPTILLLFTSIPLLGQEVNMKYGKISKAELTREFCPSDSTAAAEVLFDVGHSSIGMYGQSLQRHFRIKVYDKNLFQGTNLTIFLQNLPGSTDGIGKITAHTYKLKNGKITKTQLEKKDVFLLKQSEFSHYKRFGFPAIEDGVIIECKYEINSTYYGFIRKWRIQREIPVRYSEFAANIPTFLRYATRITGYTSINVVKTDVPRVNGSLKTWIAKDIPAFVSEEYITDNDNYIAALEFELAVIASTPIALLIGDWENINKLLHNNPRFGNRIRSGFQEKQELKKILDGSETDLSKMVKIYKYVQKKTVSSNYNTIYTYFSMSKALSGKEMPVGDINLTLVALLKAAKLNVCPVILSTRSNGSISEGVPTSTKFNYVIAFVQIDDKEYLLDATDDLLSAGMLPKRALNGNARKVCSLGTHYKIIPPAKLSTSFMYVAEFTEKQELIAEVSGKLSGYSAYNYRKESEEMDKRMTENESDEITELKVTNEKDIDKNITIKYKFKSNRNVEFAGDMIYLSPILENAIKENPFKLDQRKYPVDFAYPINESIVFIYTIPKGYEVADLPENMNISLPEKAGSYKFLVSVNGNKLQIISKFKINKPVFIYNEYASLKQFYDTVINKQAEKIVFKKK